MRAGVHHVIPSFHLVWATNEMRLLRRTQPGFAYHPGIQLLPCWHCGLFHTLELNHAR